MKLELLNIPVQLSDEVQRAIKLSQPVVALESTVITHGLPYPENLALARDMENTVRELGATPATIAVLDGQILAGLNDTQLERLGNESGLHKISSRDFSTAIAFRWSGGTTVAGTLVVADRAGIRVFATGGIGGVHRSAPGEQTFDISADLELLARTPVIVVCAGAKAILDLPATLEVLETKGVPVIGYKTDEFPAFYSISSGLPVSARAESPAEIASVAQAHWGINQTGALLVGNPPPAEVALDREQMEAIIEQALHELYSQKVHGQKVTPFLLARVSELTKGASLLANLSLLKNNAQLAAQIAIELRTPKERRVI